jgi:hypothetical protein
MPLVIANNSQEINTYPVAHDPQEEKYYLFTWKPYTWQTNKLYYVDDIVIPEVFNGFYYLCTDPGLSGEVSPDFPTLKRTTVKDNNIIWKTFPYDFHLREGDVITSSNFKAYNIDNTLNNDITISNDENDGYRTYCKVSTVPVNIDKFILTNEVDILLSNNTVERYNRSILVNVITL